MSHANTGQVDVTNVANGPSRSGSKRALWISAMTSLHQDIISNCRKTPTLKVSAALASDALTRLNSMLKFANGKYTPTSEGCEPCGNTPGKSHSNAPSADSVSLSQPIYQPMNECILARNITCATDAIEAVAL